MIRVGIIGTRGIPNHYGGFEQFAELLSVYLVKNSHEVFVYNSSTHPYQEKTFKNVRIIHCSDPEKKIGTIGQFLYDLNCILDSRKRNFDVILQLGYTSSSIWSFLFPKKSILITNMDGLEWKRAKYSLPIKTFLKYAEKLAVKHSDFLISDSLGIQNYLEEKYNATSKYIPYGAKNIEEPSKLVLNKYHLLEYTYNLLIARLEPENNIESILDGVVLSKKKPLFLVIGSYANKFGYRLKEKFKNHEHILFLGSIYNSEELNSLRYFSNLYFHGHSVGGTNPSLLEAMGCNALIIAHDNIFNKAVLEEEGYYFSNMIDIKNHLLEKNKLFEKEKLNTNRIKINQQYNINNVNSSYLSFFYECLEANKDKINV